MTGPGRLRNGQMLPEARIPLLPGAEFVAAVRGALAEGGRLAAWFGRSVAAGSTRVYAVIARDAESRLEVFSGDAAGVLPALTPEFAQAHLFERELAEQFGVRPEGHPWLKPVRNAPMLAGSGGADGATPPWDAGGRPIPGAHEFYGMTGEEVHEVAVGPVHAGIIEPGHFRFQCAGERVLHLEIMLGYQHRGAVRMLERGPDRRTAAGVESLSGDTAVGNALAWSVATEALAGCKVPARGQVLRGIALELERLANHVGDLGMLGTDIGFLPTSAWFGRLRGEFLNQLMEWSGNRFGRGLIRPGGVTLDLTAAMASGFRARLEQAHAELGRIAEVFFGSPSVMARLEGTGAVPRQAALDLGLVGPPARAAGVARDLRQDHPIGIYRFAHLPISTAEGGDVFGRTMVRWLEVQRSLEFMADQLGHLPEGPTRSTCGPAAASAFAVALVEGWRGELVHAVITGADGRYARYVPVDPSFHNWTGLAYALRGQQISDFPLCNKSFNLAYAGFDQ